MNTEVSEIVIPRQEFEPWSHACGHTYNYTIEDMNHRQKMRLYSLLITV